MSIGKNIYNLRRKYHMSQDELARIVGVTNKAVSSWELDKKIPRMGAIQKMADHFGIKKSDIIEDEILESNMDLRQSTKSTEYRMTLSPDEFKLLHGYCDLNNDGKITLLNVLESLRVSNPRSGVSV